MGVQRSFRAADSQALRTLVSMPNLHGLGVRRTYMYTWQRSSTKRRFRIRRYWRAQNFSEPGAALTGPQDCEDLSDSATAIAEVSPADLMAHGWQKTSAG